MDAYALELQVCSDSHISGVAFDVWGRVELMGGQKGGTNRAPSRRLNAIQFPESFRQNKLLYVSNGHRACSPHFSAAIHRILQRVLVGPKLPILLACPKLCTQAPQSPLPCHRAHNREAVFYGASSTNNAANHYAHPKLIACPTFCPQALQAKVRFMHGTCHVQMSLSAPIIAPNSERFPCLTIILLTGPASSSGAVRGCVGPAPCNPYGPCSHLSPRPLSSQPREGGPGRRLSWQWSLCLFGLWL